ncbi:DNA end protector protein [Pseudomonas phage Astolliot]|nr:DNA end protector protein [Pseudomonas phage Astolliot]
MPVNTQRRVKPAIPSLVEQFRSQLNAMNSFPNAKKNNKSVAWFTATVKNIPLARVGATPEPGKMYTYVYDAKYKKTLPYWDKFPLIIMLDVNAQYQLGLNLHYVPPKFRQIFLEKLLASNPSLLNQKTIGPRAKFKINWAAVKKYPGADKMIKLYIRSRIKGKMVEISPTQWANTIYLPTQQFLDKDGKRFSARKVWSDGKTR